MILLTLFRMQKAASALDETGSQGVQPSEETERGVGTLKNMVRVGQQAHVFIAAPEQRRVCVAGLGA